MWFFLPCSVPARFQALLQCTALAHSHGTVVCIWLLLSPARSAHGGLGVVAGFSPLGAKVVGPQSIWPAFCDFSLAKWA